MQQLLISCLKYNVQVLIITHLNCSIMHPASKYSILHQSAAPPPPPPHLFITVWTLSDLSTQSIEFSCLRRREIWTNLHPMAKNKNSYMYDVA